MRSGLYTAFCIVIGTLQLSANASQKDCVPAHVVQGILHTDHPSLKKAEALIESKSQPLEKNILYSNDHGETSEIFGVPKEAKLYHYEPNEVFRYYTHDEVVNNMLADHHLKAGVLPYVISHPGLKKEYYYSLEGAFMTKPEFHPWQVGLEKNPNMSYVDFSLPPGMGVIQLESGIFLIPGKPAVQPWIGEAYRKFKASGEAVYPAQYEKIFKRMDATEHIADVPNPIIIREYRSGGVVKKP